ncbi:hypothetical protein AAE478_009078 [Parahypoxylon ruwenzoriense]
MAPLAKLILKAIGASPLDNPPALRPALTTSSHSQELGRAAHTMQDNADNEKHLIPNVPVETGTSVVGASQAIWGKKGRWLIIAGLCLIMIIYEIDNSTVYIYRNYATSEFEDLSKLATLSTAGTIIFAVAKPPIAKLSNVIGRGATYLLAICFYILASVLMASAQSFSAYATGAVFYSLGQSGTNLMNDVVIADLTTARFRALGIALSFWPFLITPWTAGFIVDSVTAPAGIGWRWGTARNPHAVLRKLYHYHSSILPDSRREGEPRAQSQDLAISLFDLGGVILFSGGLALLLIPDDNRSYHAVELEEAMGRHVDSHGLEARDATFFTYTNGVTQYLIAIITSLAMAKTRRFKLVYVAGTAVRLVGYGVMLRLRGSENSLAEIFIVQLVQGIGSGMVGSTLLIPAQAVVTHAEMPQITALVICFAFVGGSVGACIAGGIYTSTIESALRYYLGDGAAAETVSVLANSITGVVPNGFSEVMRYMTFASLGPSAIAFVASLFMPNFELP